MAIREFGNGFKTTLNEGLRNTIGVNLETLPNFFTGEHNYAGTQSAVIDRFWNVANGPAGLFGVTARGQADDWRRNVDGGNRDFELGRQICRLYNQGVEFEQIGVTGGNDVQVRVDEVDCFGIDDIVWRIYGVRRINGWLAPNGCGIITGDGQTPLNALAEMGYNPGGDEGEVANAFQQYHRSFNTIRDRGAIANKTNAWDVFIQRMHKEITIAKITLYLAREPAVIADQLPDQNEYREYANYIRGANAEQVTALVNNIQGAKNSAIKTAAIIAAATNGDVDGVDVTGLVEPELSRINRFKALRKVVIAQQAVIADVAGATDVNANAAYTALNAFAQHEANRGNTDANGYSGWAWHEYVAKVAAVGTAFTDLRNKVDTSWNDFFEQSVNHEVVFGNATTGVLTILQTAARNAWKAVGLTASPAVPGNHNSQADTAWGLGWRDLVIGGGNPADGTGRVTAVDVANHKISYTSHGTATDGIDLLVNNKAHIDRAHQLWARINNPATAEADLGNGATVARLIDAIPDTEDAIVPDTLKKTALHAGRNQVLTARRAISAWRTTMVAAAAPGSRNTALNIPANNTVLDNWFNLTKAGTGNIDNDKLTAVMARALYSYNWESTDIGNDGSGQIQVPNPFIPGQFVKGYDDIIRLGDKNKFTQKAKFITDFKAAVPGSTSASVTDPNIILNYFEIVPAKSAAELYNGGVPASSLSKPSAGKVTFNGVTYNDSETAKIIAAKKALDAENARLAALASARSAAITALQTSLDDTPDNKPKITEEQVKNQLNKTKPDTITDSKTWKDYINEPDDTTEVEKRQKEVEAAIEEIRKNQKPEIPFDAQKVRNDAIAAVKTHWKSKSSDKTETGTVKGKTITEVLGTDWEVEFEDKDKENTISSKKNELIGKIDAAEKKKKKEPEQKQFTEEESMEAFQELFKEDEEDARVEPIKEKVETWTKYTETGSKLKTKEEVKKFIKENVKSGKESDFAKYLEEKLPAADQPTGKNELEKVNKFLVSQDAEKVIKTIFAFKVEKDANFRAETETKMNEAKDEEKVLDENIYPKKDGKFTPEAMARFLFEEQTGKSHQFAAEGQKEGTPTPEPSHWDKHKWKWIGGLAILATIAGLAWIFWDKITGSKEEEEEE